ncbi:putative tetratricopeptide-like helical domain-containing protein [Sesbania bispinosa]|nr:putative tetratricopeptide-like helical domain-containing protein [Sesbania bispinosa]
MERHHRHWGEADMEDEVEGGEDGGRDGDLVVGNGVLDDSMRRGRGCVVARRWWMMAHRDAVRWSGTVHSR